MSVLPDVGMILADTSRSRVYLQAMAASGLNPAEALVLTDPARRPGQLEPGQALRFAAPWGEADLSRDAASCLAAAGIPHRFLPTGDINGPAAVSALAAGSCRVYIYSGFGGVILRPPVLSCGKRFLHVHGGYLPDYKGSTTNYYSYLAEGTCGASAIFMTAHIDSGPIVARRRFVPQESLLGMDHVLDPCYRALVLCEALAAYRRLGVWPETAPSGEGLIYYVMHPLLRHAAICKSLGETHA